MLQYLVEDLEEVEVVVAKEQENVSVQDQEEAPEERGQEHPGLGP